ncbi:MAG TPA: LytTR family DNA-binding domain-containing protein [Gemmatimonadaceae bacterium]|nr:LytTR family DNA-binding domain-containing protein [Gemmatimonadaceae bacterium]
MTAAALRAVVIDDERLARREMCTLLAADGRVEVVGEGASPSAGAALVERLRPDVVFLDIRLGRASGFELLEQLDDPDVAIVFVTAYDEHAVRAFDVNALDYLLKPVEPRRLTRAVDRLVARAAARAGRVTPATVPERAAVAAKPLVAADWLFVRAGERRAFVQLATVTHLSASGDWVTLHLADGRALRTGDPLGDWERRLPASFLRIHRAAIVNLAYVARLEPWSHGSWQVWLRAGSAAPLPLSRRYAARARELLGAG